MWIPIRLTAADNNLIGRKNDHFKRKNAVRVKNAILLMETNQKRSDVEKVAPHMIIEKYQHTDMRNKYEYNENSLLQRKNKSNQLKRSVKIEEK